jgi:transcriptional regulator with XRE-family HTH domain
MSSKLTRHNGMAIRYLRIKDGLKPGEFATKVGVSYAHLDNLENERKEASLEVLHKVATALNVPVEAIVRNPASLIAKSVAA